jgi:secernin
LCVIGRDRTVFGKNSDRPVGEPQVVEAHDPRASGGRVRTQYLEIPDTGASALLGSRPEWLWGFEHGVNEHRVAIGNEKVWTVDDPHAAAPALLGMDLVRLGLERGRTADEAFDAITTLLAQHGQGGSGEEHADEPYWSSFLVADPRGAWILETSATRWAARPVEHGASISNRLSLGRAWTRASTGVDAGTDLDAWLPPRMSTGHADKRLAATGACVASTATTVSPRDVVATLRHHGDRAWGRPGDPSADVSFPPSEILPDGTGVSVCMHIPGYQATTASMVAELPAARDEPARAWVALGNPCASVYIPVFPPAHVPDALARPETWQRFRALRDRVDADHGVLRDVRSVFAPLEAHLWDDADDALRAGTDADLGRSVATAWREVEAALAQLERD